LKANEIVFAKGPSVFKVKGEIYGFIGPMHQADDQQPKCLQTFFVDANMQTDVGNQRFGPVNLDTMRELRNMLELHNSYVRSFVTIDEQLRAGLLPQSVTIELMANRHPTGEHRGRYNVPTTNEEFAILIPGIETSRRSIVI